MNYADSEKISMIMLQSGFALTNDWKDAEVIIFNSCSVRQKWEDRIFWMINEIIKERKIQNLDSNNPTKLIFWITWCMVRKTWMNQKYIEANSRTTAKKIEYISSKEGMYNFDDKLFPRIPELDFTLRIEEVKYLPHIIWTITWKTLGQDDKFDDYLKAKQLRENPHSANIIIQTWCDNFCSFCIVPHTRNREVSRPVEEILNEIREAVKSWASEINLLGQNVNSYWKQFVEKKLWNEEKSKWNTPHPSPLLWEEREQFCSPFRSLLNEINKIEGIDRIRFTSSNPHDMTRDILDSHFELDKMCNYLHIALQSWSDELLKKMNRRHDYEDFKDMIDYLRSRDRLFSISTDIIVWFSGETEEDFQATAKALRECDFDFVFIARYSVRKWTIASKLYPDDVSEEEKSRRWHILNEILKENYIRRANAMIWKTFETMVTWEKDAWEYTWRTRNFKEVIFKSETKLNPWEIVNVEFISVNNFVITWEIK